MYLLIFSILYTVGSYVDYFDPVWRYGKIIVRQTTGPSLIPRAQSPTDCALFHFVCASLPVHHHEYWQ